MDKNKEFNEFKSELQKLLKKHKVYLYVEDVYGAELTNIFAYRHTMFDKQVLDNEFLEEIHKLNNITTKQI